MSHVVWIGKTLVGWLLLPCLFILIYVFGLGQPQTAIAPHLLMAFWLASFMTGIGVLAVNATGTRSLFFRGYVVACALLVFLLCLYYALVLIGIRAWAHVVTIEIIGTYARQLPELLQALGISLWLVMPLVVLLFSAIYLATRGFYSWVSPKPFAVSVSKTLKLGLLAVVIVFCADRLRNALSADALDKHEPLAMTLYAGQAHDSHYATQGIENDPKWSQREEAARHSYAGSNGTAEKRNIIIILSDALRQDHMSVYGYSRDTTPWLRSMADAGKLVRFDNANSTCAETTCAHASLLGSRHIRQLPEQPFSLQEVLKSGGYHTRMIISGDHVHFYNIRQIYGGIDDYYDGSMAKGYYINDDKLVLEKTQSLPEWDGQPNFIHYHLLSNHVLGRRFDAYRAWTPAKPYYGVSRSRPRQEYTNFYDNGVLQTDAVIRELLETLGRKGYLRNALVIVTADHGDALGEHGLMNHANGVYQETLHVPLLFIPYGYQSGIRNDGQPMVSLIDIAPTALTEVGMPIPATWQGAPLQQPVAKRRLFFMMQPVEGLYDDRDDGAWKYWRNRLTGEEFAFELRSDPGETKNLIPVLPERKKQDWRDTMRSIIAP